MKNILVIGTGGTIASEMASDGLTPELSANQLLQYVPQVQDFCRPVCKQIFSIDSTNMSPSRWLQIAACIRQHYDDFDGFVIKDNAFRSEKHFSALPCWYFQHLQQAETGSAG